MGELLSVRATAKRIGVSHVALFKAIERGRLVESVVRGADGVQLDPEKALAEWRRISRRQPAAPAQGSKPVDVARSLGEIIEADLRERNRRTLALVPPAVEGAAAVLDAAGRGCDLAAALDAEGEDAGVELATRLLAVAEGDHDKPGADRVEIARNVGREAAADWLRGRR